MDLFEKCRNYTLADEFRAKGIYPYFRALESRQDKEVIMEGKRRIMKCHMGERRASRHVPQGINVFYRGFKIFVDVNKTLFCFLYADIFQSKIVRRRRTTYGYQ